MEINEEYNQFLQDLQQYPNYFQMGTENCSSNFWRKIAKKIEDEKEELLESSDLDRIQNQNLEACASYNLGKVDKAEQIISKVLEETNSSSINACAMMAILRYEKGDITKAKRHLRHIKELAVDPYHIDVAKSELAYAYTRLDAIFYKKAIEAYTEAVERNPNNIPWKFGLALIYRRCMNTSIHAMFPDLQLETCFNEAKKHLTYVLENCTDEKERFFKGRSYIELADLYTTANTTNKLTKTEERKIIDLVNQGVQCLPMNTTILMNAGRLLRHCFKFDEAEKLLQKAYDICPNSYICHHLGLIKKNRIIYQHRQSQGIPKGNQRHGRYKRNQTFSSRRSQSYPSTSAPQQKVNKQLDQQSKYLISDRGSKSLIQLNNSLSSKSEKEPEPNEPIKDSTKALTEPKPSLKPDEDTKPILKPDEGTKPILKPDEGTIPILKPDEETIPILKPDEDTIPILKPDEDIKPILKPDEDIKPILKPDEDTKPILKPDEDTKPILKPDEDIKPRLKPDEDTKPRLKPDEDIKPRLKPDEDTKPILKPDEDTIPILNPDEDIKNSTVRDNDLEEDLAIAEPVYQHSFSQDDNLDLAENPTKHHQQLAVKGALDNPNKTMATGGPTILPTESKKERETLSKASLTNIAEPGKELVNLSESSPSQTLPVDSPWQIFQNKQRRKKKPVFKMKESESSPSLTPPVSKMSEDVSLWQTSTIEKSGLQNKPIFNMKRLINSPKNETFNLELSRKLDPCLDLFRQSAELGQERNLLVYYDWGITLLQMTPTKFDEVMEKFDHILANDRSQFMRYRCYEQYGICKLRMSELQDLEEISREDYREDAKEMFRSAIRSWAYCQKLNLSKHFDDAEGNCNSLISIREIILGEDSSHGTNSKKDMASLYYLVKQYGSSLSLYQEVHDELQRTSDTAMDSEGILGIIRNHLQLQHYRGVLDLLALLLCLKEGLQCLKFKTDVLKQMMHYSIDTNDYHLSESVFEFEKDPNGEVDNDVAIIFNEEDQVSKTKGATLQKWLHAFSKSGLKVIKIIETAANLPRLQEQIKLIYNSKIAIFILANETPSTELTYLMNTALEARCNNSHFLKKIFPIIINDGMVPDIFKIFRCMKITHQPNTLEEQEKSEFLKTFSDVFLE